MSGLPGKGRGSGGDDGEENKRRGAQDKNKAPAKPQPKRPALTVEQRAAVNQQSRQRRSDKAEQAKHNPELGAELRKKKDEINERDRIHKAQKRTVDKEKAEHDPALKAKLLNEADQSAARMRNYRERKKAKETALASPRPETSGGITWQKPETLLSYGSPQPELLNSKKMDIQFEEYDPQNPEGIEPQVPRVRKPRTDLGKPRKCRPYSPRKEKVPRVAEPRPLPSSSYGYDDSQTGYAMQPPTNVGRGEQRPSFAVVDPANQQLLASLDARGDQARTGWRPGPAPANLPSLDQRRENTGRRPRPTGADLNPAVTLSMGNLSMTTTTVPPRRLRNSPPDNSDDRARLRPPNFRPRFTDEQTRENMNMNKFLDDRGGS